MSITIQGLVGRVSRFAALVGLFAAVGSAAAQATGDNAIERIDATQTTTSTLVETTGTVHELAGISTELQQVIGRFRL